MINDDAALGAVRGKKGEEGRRRMNDVSPATCSTTSLATSSVVKQNLGSRVRDAKLEKTANFLLE